MCECQLFSSRVIGYTRHVTNYGGHLLRQGAELSSGNYKRRSLVSLGLFVLVLLIDMSSKLPVVGAGRGRRQPESGGRLVAGARRGASGAGGVDDRQ